MEDILKLDFRIIIGDVTNNTPFFVIDYICKFAKIIYKESHINIDSYYSEIITIINNYEYPEIVLSDNETDSDISKIIKFISPYYSSEWLFENIIDGYDHMMSFSFQYDLPKFEYKDLTFGDKTNDNPFNINQIILYRLGLHYGYSMNKNTTYNELLLFIERITSKKINLFKNSLLHTINSMNESDILKIYYDVSNMKTISSNEKNFEFIEGRENILTFDSSIFEMTLNNLMDNKKLLSRIKAKTNYEAIIIAAIKYKINIIDSQYPLKELENLSKNTYIPYCQTFSKKYNSNTDFYNLNKTWVENLSNSEIYSISQMKEFALNEGFHRINSLSFNELNSYMKSTKNMFNFYFGKHPLCKNNQTIMLTPIIEIPNNELICFGIENKCELYYISVSELNEYFFNIKMYIEPINNKIIDRRAILKLKLYCKNNQLSEYCKLLTTLEELDKIEKLLDLTSFKIKSNLKIYSKDIVDKIDKFFNNTMEMALYMRGWKVNESIEFPLESQYTIFNESDIVPIDKVIDKSIYGETGYTNKQRIIDNTIIALNEAMESLNKLPNEIICDIKKLHTIRFNSKDTSVEIMGQLFKGAKIYTNETLVECMKNIYKGLENPDSCMRTNSNWILYSSIWYRMIFGFHVPFKIDRIHEIS